jgi:cell volume regulation protein A
MRLFIFLLQGSQVDFDLMGQYLVGGNCLRRNLHVRRSTGHTSSCVRYQTVGRGGVSNDAVHALDSGSRRRSGSSRRLLLGTKAPGARMIMSVTFIAIVMTILIQAATTKWLGSKLLLEEGVWPC